jgi:8-oxoguanine deaminase
MSLGQSLGGLPPDSVVEDEADILRDTRRLIEEYHDPLPGAMLRVVVAPCSPFSVSDDLMRESARLARAYGVRLHTHLAETLEEQRFCLAQRGVRPVALMERLDWLGPDVWFAHGVHVDRAEIEQFARLGSGVAHCPSSNMRLAAGVAPLQCYRAAGVAVGLGVDGSASNDGSHMLAEARQAMLVARLLRSQALAGDEPVVTSGEPALAGDEPWLTARDVLELATLGGAAVLGRDDVGSLEVGKFADFFAIDLNRVEYAGALHDPVAATVFCAPQTADYTYVHGRAIVTAGHLTTVDPGPLVEKHNQIAHAMVSG